MYLVDSESSEFVSVGIMFFLLQHQNCLPTSDRATLDFYFPLTVSGSIGDTFGFTNLIRHSSKSEFYNVCRQDKCPSLDLRSFDPQKTLKNYLVSSTFH